MIRVLVIAIYLLSLPVFADTGDAGLRKAALELFPGERVDHFSEGVLDEEGNHYIAALLENQNHDLRLILLQRQHAQTFKLIAHSQLETAIGRSVFAVKILKRSVFMSLYSSGGCCSNSNETFQFKKTNNKFALIGVEGVYRDMENISPADSDAGLYYHYRLKNSVNFLANEVVHSRKAWTADQSDGEKPIGKTQYAELRLKLESPVLLYLQDFSIDAYRELEQRTKSLCGSLGKNMKFTPYSDCTDDEKHP